MVHVKGKCLVGYSLQLEGQGVGIGALKARGSE